MAFRLPRRLKLGCERPFGRSGNMVALVGLGALFAASAPLSLAQAQVIIGGSRGPAVSVDDSVLERLGPPLTLPQLFLGERHPGAIKRQVATNQRSAHSAAPVHRRGKHVATRSKAATHKTAVAKAVPSHAATAPVQTASSLHQIIHLIPPGSRVASAAPTPPAEISHQEAAISTPTKPAVAALVAPVPAPAPKQPASSDSPIPAVVSPQQAREETPPAPVAPPAQPVVAATPPVAAPGPTFTAPHVAPPTAAPSSTVAAAPAAPPSPSVTPAPPAISAPPVQMAAATTVGNAASAVKFKQGATDLGSGPQPVLDAIANRLLANENLRVQVVSHATGGADDAMEARRISLARAVAVRAYLIDKGVRSLRIDVRALGNRADNGPVADQVDLLVVSQ